MAPLMENGLVGQLKLVFIKSCAHDELCTNVKIIFLKNNLLDLKYHIFYLGCEEMKMCK